MRQINPDTTFSALGMGSSAYTNSLMSMSASTDVFAEMVGNTRIVEEQYDVVAGHWPQSYNECVLVLTSGGNISDFMSYVLGLRDASELKTMVNQFMAEEQIEVELDDIDITYDDILSKRFKLVNAADFYQHDAEHNVWIDKSDDKAYMTELVNAGEDLVISGIVKAKPEAKSDGSFHGRLLHARAHPPPHRKRRRDADRPRPAGPPRDRRHQRKDLRRTRRGRKRRLVSRHELDVHRRRGGDKLRLQHRREQAHRRHGGAAKQHGSPLLPAMPPADPNAFAIESTPEVNGEALPRRRPS